MSSLMVLLLVGALLVPVYADRDMMGRGMMDRGTSDRGMMGGGMMTMMRGSMMMGGGMMYPLCPMAGHSALDAYISYRDELRLSDKQVKDLRAIRSAYKKEAAKRNAEITNLQSDLDELYDADKLDYKAIGKKVDEIEAIQSKLRSAYFNSLDKADKVLTEEQRLKALKLSGGMMHEMKETPSEKEHMH